MRTIIIDSVNRTVREDHPEKIDLDYLYKAVGCEMVEVVNIDDKADLYVDEEGLLKPQDHFFYYEGAHQPFAGNGAICSYDHEDGAAIGTDLPLTEVLNKVRFMTRLEALVFTKRHCQ